MNLSTITTKTGVTAILSIIGTAIGVYTGALPIGTGVESIITALLALFVRDGITAHTAATEELRRAAEKQAQEMQRSNDVKAASSRQYERIQRPDMSTASGA